MLAIIPNHPIIAGLILYILKRVEYARVPIEKKICANKKLDFFDLRILRRISFNDFFSSLQAAEYFLAILRSPQYLFLL